MTRSALFLSLTIAAAGATAEPRAVVAEVVVEASVADVWKAWTTMEGIVSFFAEEARIDLRPGGRYEILFGNGIGCNGCSIMAIQPERLLAFTWNSPPHLPEVRPHFTHVTVRFQPLSAARTGVRLREDGWGEGGEWDESFAYFSEAWPRVLRSLQESFEKKGYDDPARKGGSDEDALRRTQAQRNRGVLDPAHGQRARRDGRDGRKGSGRSARDDR